MTFLQKGRIKDVLRDIPDDAPVVFDRRKVDHVDEDVEEIIDEWCAEHAAGGPAIEVLFEPGGEARRAARAARGQGAGH